MPASTAAPEYRGRLYASGGTKARPRIVVFRIVRHLRPRCQKKWTAWVARAWRKEAMRPVPYQRTPEDVLAFLRQRYRPVRVQWRGDRPCS